jgi:hypothetical protein
MAINEKMWDLGVEVLADGQINLEQESGCGEMVRITLHPMQIRLLAERSGLLKQVPAATWPRGFHRRIERLRDHADDLLSLLDVVLCYPPGSPDTYEVTMARALLEKIDDMMADYFEEQTENIPTTTGGT